MADDDSTGRIYKTPLKQRLRAAQYRLEHREERRAYNQKWRKEHYENHLASLHNRRAKKRAGGRHTAIEWKRLNDSFGWRCLRCGVHHSTSPMTRDHVLPLAQGGTNAISNIQPLCNPCNVWKGARHIDYRALLPEQNAIAEAAVLPYRGFKKSPHTEDTKRRLSAALTGFKHNETVRKNMSIGVKDSWTRRGAWRKSKSGVRGVSWDATAARWRASLTVDGKLKHVGRFETVEDAAAALARFRKEPQ